MTARRIAATQTIAAPASQPEEGTLQAHRITRLWLLPLMVVVIYPALILSFGQALTGYYRLGNGLLAAYALVSLLFAASIPVLAIRALVLMRHDEGSGPARNALLLMCATPSLFSLSYTLARMVGIVGADRYGALVLIWMSAWITVGVMLYLRKEGKPLVPASSALAPLRIVHGVTALCLLCGFLVAHLINNDLAVWSVDLHGAAMKLLRLWYRSEWVEPVLLALVLVMICTGVPMVRHYARRPMDTFRIVQMATGVSLGVFLCSHVLATLNARRQGIETDWIFAAGPTGLLSGGGLSGRLIPHYFFAAFFLVLHVACGLRVVLLQHGATPVVVNRIFWGLALVGLMATVLVTAALLGFHVESV